MRGPISQWSPGSRTSSKVLRSGKCYDALSEDALVPGLARYLREKEGINSEVAERIAAEAGATFRRESSVRWNPGDEGGEDGGGSGDSARPIAWDDCGISPLTPKGSELEAHRTPPRWLRLRGKELRAGCSYPGAESGPAGSGATSAEGGPAGS